MRWPRHLLTTHRTNVGGEARFPENLTRKFKPGAVAVIGYVHDSACVSPAKLHDRLRQVVRKRRAATLVIDYVERRAAGSQPQNRLRKTPSPGPEQPRCPYNATLGYKFE